MMNIRHESNSSISSMGFETSSAIDEELMKKYRTYAKFCSCRLIQAVVQARCNAKFDTKCEIDATGTWFNLNMAEIGEISAQVKKSITRFPPDISMFCIDFFLYTKEGDSIPLESWCFGFDNSKKANDDNGNLYLELSCLLNRQSSSSTSTLREETECGYIHHHVSEGPSNLKLGSTKKVIRLAQYSTEIGSFYLDLAYRLRVEIEQKTSISPVSDSYHKVDHPSGHSGEGQSTSPEGKSSFCEIDNCSISPQDLALSPPADYASSSPIGSHILPPSSFPARARSRTQSASSFNTGSISPTETGRRSREPSGSLPIPKDLPFGGLLTMSLTGTLSPLSPTIEEHPKRQHMHISEETENEVFSEQKDSGLDETLKSTTLQDDDNPLPPIHSSVFTSTLKSDTTLDLQSSREKHSSGEAVLKGDASSSKDSPKLRRSKEDDAEEDDDSFILPFAARGTTPNAEIEELVTACRYPIEIPEFEDTESVEGLFNVKDFAQRQTDFDNFVKSLTQTNKKS